MTFEEQIKLIKLEELKKTRKPSTKKPKPKKDEVTLRYGRNRVRGSKGDLNYRQIADLILSGIKVKVRCTLTGKDVTERIVLGTMNSYLANYTGNLEKYLEILTTSKK